MLPSIAIGARSFNLNHTYSTEGTFTVSVTLRDDDTNGAVDTFQVSVALNNPPTVAADSGAISTPEGTPATNTGSFSDPQGNGTVDLTASFGTVVKNDAEGTWSWRRQQPDGPVSPTQVTVTATDSDGAQSTISFALVVNNVAPTAAVDNANANEGDLVTLDGTFSDPGVDGHVQEWSVVAANGQTIVPLIIPERNYDADTLPDYKDSDDDGDGILDAMDTDYDNDGTADDQDLDDDNDGVSDGPSNASSGWRGSRFSFTPSDNGIYTVTYKVTDDDGGVHSDTAVITVDNVAPSITISGNANVDEGSNYSLTLGAVSDPGTDTVTSYMVHWGDGSSDPYGTGGVKTHSYADGPNSYNITVDLVDEDGTFADASQ